MLSNEIEREIYSGIQATFLLNCIGW